ncbi:sigma-70 family RNA polymerase sigma factor [Sphingobium sp. CR2-8]|uniref:RNA polymerase sigma factor n=1 Tax=Sphingobium sp. CR2-8 TaxID=1306534 RepID=UPI002DB962B5|nr:sigma-70 family RNA polymerase sigma factor [Sphingobium sp. CR2-8]MEC3909160.1 sigma-70 family RNA polymerase sigma factor [Sphingobium sp. CR2-8]
MENQALEQKHSDRARYSLLNRLARLYARPLTRYFERRVTNQHDVPDLVQDVFLRLSALPDPLSIEKPEHYLFVTAASSLRDKARRDSARQITQHLSLDENIVPGSDMTPLRVLEGREAISRLREALLALPERSRDIFVLRVFEECRMNDIAAAIGISRRAVEKHYARALAHVIHALEDWRHR